MNKKEPYEMTIKLYVNAYSKDQALEYGEDLITSIDINLLSALLEEPDLNDVYINGSFDIFVNSVISEYNFIENSTTYANENRKH